MRSGKTDSVLCFRSQKAFVLSTILLPTLDTIDRLPVSVVIPGHGAPFTPLSRAKSRLRAFRETASKHARHAAKVLVKFHMLEVQSALIDDLIRWMARTDLLSDIWHAPVQRDTKRGLAFAADSIEQVGRDIINC